MTELGVFPYSDDIYPEEEEKIFFFFFRKTFHDLLKAVMNKFNLFLI